MFLEKATGAILGKAVSLSKNLEIFACKRITMKSSKYPDIDPEIDFWLPEGKESSLLYVNTDGGKNRRWNSLAGGVAELAGMENYRADFQNFLQEKERDECLRTLRNAPFGLTEEALQELQTIEEPGNLTEDHSSFDEKFTSDNEETFDEPVDGNSHTHANGGVGPSVNSGRTDGGRPTGGGSGGGGNPNPDVEEAAVEAVRKYYGEDNVHSVEMDKKGWDLEVSQPNGETLHVEVKGISASRISVKLTPNEYSKSDNDVYRLAVVRNALNDNLVAIYKRCGNEWWKVDGNDEDASQRLVVEEETGAKVKEDGRR